MASYRSLIDLEKIMAAAQRISGQVYQTPIMTSSCVDSLMKGSKCLYFKCEHLQKTGSFKVRGALNSIIKAKEQRLHDTGKSLTGVCTHSSGNHGQAVAWAAKITGIPSIVVVPETAAQVKCRSIENYNASLVKCVNTPLARSQTCDEVAQSTGYEIILPYDSYDTMEGQGTVGLEFMQQVPDLDAILVSVSGGGLASGVAVAAKSMKPSIKIYCVEVDGKYLGPSLEAKERLWTDPPKTLKTIADGIALQQVGRKTFPILCDLTETTVITVNDSEIMAAMQLVFHHMKQVIEGAAGAVVAAALKFEFPADVKKIGLILCGGNVDIKNLPWYTTLTPST